MIWHRGAIFPDDALLVPVSDRSLEHGLGLFETTRTWSGRPALLDRHRSRLFRSAAELGLTIRPEDWPTEPDVARLLEAEGASGDRVLRITATGGTGLGPSLVWMNTRPLPRPLRPAAIVQVGSWAVDRNEPMARHKALNYWSRRLAFERASASALDESLSLGDGRIWEGSRTNLFVIAGDRLMTPSTRGPIVPGIMRALVLASAPETGLLVEEVDGVGPADLRDATEVFLSNAVRGIIPVGRVVDHDGAAVFDRPAPGPWTARLRTIVEAKIGGSP